MTDEEYQQLTEKLDKANNIRKKISAIEAFLNKKKFKIYNVNTANNQNHTNLAELLQNSGWSVKDADDLVHTIVTYNLCKVIEELKQQLSNL